MNIELPQSKGRIVTSISIDPSIMMYFKIAKEEINQRVTIKDMVRNSMLYGFKHTVNSFLSLSVEKHEKILNRVKEEITNS